MELTQDYENAVMNSMLSKIGRSISTRMQDVLVKERDLMIEQ